MSDRRQGCSCSGYVNTTLAQMPVPGQFHALVSRFSAAGQPLAGPKTCRASAVGSRKLTIAQELFGFFTSWAMDKMKPLAGRSSRKFARTSWPNLKFQTALQSPASRSGNTSEKRRQVAAGTGTGENHHASAYSTSQDLSKHPFIASADLQPGVVKERTTLFFDPPPCFSNPPLFFSPLNRFPSLRCV